MQNNFLNLDQAACCPTPQYAAIYHAVLKKFGFKKGTSGGRDEEFFLNDIHFKKRKRYNTYHFGAINSFIAHKLIKPEMILTQQQMLIWIIYQGIKCSE